jgi:hypothetical protein
LEFLQLPLSQRWNNVTAQQLTVSLDGSAPDLFLAPPGRADRNPPLGPLRKGDSVRRDVRADIAGMKQTPQFLLRVGFGATKCSREPLPMDAIAKAPRIFAARIDPAIPVSSFLAHDPSSFCPRCS